ncbi:MAG: type IV pilus secretin PilQ [Nitrospiraceae bacterium]|nr:type IV pilus secretin PilQ [Nitrospiraceae bacterium]
MGIKFQKYTNKKFWALIILLSLILAPGFDIAFAQSTDKGPPVSIELRDVELRDVLRALGQEHGINIIIDEKITGKVTVSLRQVPLWDAIDSILKGKGFAYIREDNIVRVVPMAEDEDLITNTFTVKYANPKDIEPVIKKILSKKGDVISDTRSNTLVIKDTPSGINRAEQLLKKVDIKTGQIMIEAKIVEVNTNASKELGIQWGTTFNKGDLVVYGGGSKATGTTVDPTATTIPTATTGLATSTTANTSPLTMGTGTFGNAFNVNLPAAIGAGYGGAIGIGLLAKNIVLDLQLSALEVQGNAKILSSPKVMVLDNQEATISSGTQILIPTTTTVGTSVGTGGSTGTSTGTTTTGVTEKEATLRLTVTPRVLDNNQISLKISAKREEFDFSRAVLGIPPKVSRETQTAVIVKNGETIVIGGIFTETGSEGESGVPLLSKIPLIGWLFKKETSSKIRTELLIFITPQIKTE